MTAFVILFHLLTWFQEQPMNRTLQPYTYAVWTVKAGNEQAFIDEWSKFARWTSKNHPGGGTGRLLQDLDNPRQFVSFGPWKNLEHIKAWREDPEFKKFFAKAKELCENFQPHTLSEVATSAD